MKFSETQKKYKENIIVALDTPSLEVVEKLTAELKGLISVYKVGFELFTAHGWEAVKLIRKTGADIFLDLKFHDIPNTVAKAAEVMCEHDVMMFNVHTLGGLDMMKKTRDAVNARAEIRGSKPLVLGVTILTSHSESDIAAVGIAGKLQDRVLSLASLAKKAGLDGVVASPMEIVALRKEFGESFVIVTPGVRPVSSSKDDQKRILTPSQAFQAGASYIVVGRPITGASNPKLSAQAIIESL